MDKTPYLILLLICLGVATSANVNNQRTKKGRSDELMYIHQLQEIVQLVQSDEIYAKQIKMLEQRFEADLRDLAPVIPEFTCEPIAPSVSVPFSVHALRPSDVKIIAALGDSITAGNGIRAVELWQVFIMALRGESFSIGGEQILEDGVVTLPNILKKYYPNIQGYSQCSRTLKHIKLSAFNVAVPGATNQNLIHQAADLINKMLTNPEIDYYNDWKVITLFIGGNDLCQHCVRNITAVDYKDGIKAALDLLQLHVPRAFVNLQAMLDVGMVPDLVHPGAEELCARLHSIECMCAKNDSETRAKMRQLQLDFFTEIEKLVDSRIYDQREDFTVVLQPHLRDQEPFTYPNGSYDMSYIAPDCFHPAYKSHQAFATMLWNVMLTPIGSKPYKFNETQYPGYVCPSEDKPYFYTHLNSVTTTTSRAELPGLSSSVIAMMSVIALMISTPM